MRVDFAKHFSVDRTWRWDRVKAQATLCHVTLAVTNGENILVKRVFEACMRMDDLAQRGAAGGQSIKRFLDVKPGPSVGFGAIDPSQSQRGNGIASTNQMDVESELETSRNSFVGHSQSCSMLPTSILTFLFATTTAVAADYSRWGQYLDFPNITSIETTLTTGSERYLEIRYGPDSKLQSFTITPDLTLDGLQLPDSLQSFKLNRVQLKAIPSNFRWPASLQAIDLSSNNLTDIPKDVPWPTKLTSLYEVLSDNQLQACSPNMPSTLKDLDLGSNKLTSIRACNWPASLEKLSLSSNPLKVLSKSQKWPKQLKQLEMSNTQLQHVPSTFPDSVEQLTLNYNQIAYFPKKLPASLFTLGLSHNTITVLPSALDKFSALTAIELNNNKIAALPEGLKLAKGFRMLYLSNNKLAALPTNTDWIKQISYTLQLDGNLLTSLPPNAVFPDETNVAHNQIKVLKDISLPKKINLSENPIETVSRVTILPGSLWQTDDVTLKSFSIDQASLEALQGMTGGYSFSSFRWKTDASSVKTACDADHGTVQTVGDNNLSVCVVPSSQSPQPTYPNDDNSY
ncbi:Aste57867_8442 [Aphanomyces stellatus]|uniref:Aste57867_8442 protein n=1 Tax=Aphanomyces stellatus TaxID=120398 RepID=A0A485KKE5_9STRA|nr:hypothetical protein As57867_008410 [Aphanomyces stellatus]VFT85328.1 Aste57867_8442 [Aphanomyces stellatus]